MTVYQTFKLSLEAQTQSNRYQFFLPSAPKARNMGNVYIPSNHLPALWICPILPFFLSVSFFPKLYLEAILGQGLSSTSLYERVSYS